MSPPNRHTTEIDTKEASSVRRVYQYQVPSVLVVEDNEGDIILLQRAFKKAGIQANIEHVSTADAAMDYLFVDSQRATPRAILLDLNLVGSAINGFEILRACKTSENTRPIPVIVFTSSTNRDDILQAYLLGCNGYACKPSHSEAYHNFVTSFQRFWLETNLSPT